jgi:hypothetical protein
LKTDVKLVELKHFPHGFLNYDFPMMMPEAEEAGNFFVEEMEKYINSKD